MKHENILSRSMSGNLGFGMISNRSEKSIHFKVQRGQFLKCIHTELQNKDKLRGGW